MLSSAGAIHIPNVASVDGTPIDTARRRRNFVARMRQAGAIPRLNGWTVVLAGVGSGVNDRNLAANLRLLWSDYLVPAMGANVGSIDSSLRLG